jgi:signal transduction histidine kinase
MKARSFSTVVTIVIVSLVGLPSVLATFYFQESLVKNEKNRIESESNLVFERIKETLQQEIRVMSTRLKTLGADSDLRMGNRSILFYERIQKRLEDFKFDTPLAQSIYFFGTQNRLISTFPPELETTDFQDLQITLEKIVGSDQKNGPRLKEEVNSQIEIRQHFPSEHNQDKMAQKNENDFGYFLFQPVFDIFGEPAGSLIAFLNTAHLKSLAIQNLNADFNANSFEQTWNLSSQNSMTQMTKLRSDSRKIDLQGIEASFDLDAHEKLDAAERRKNRSFLFGSLGAILGIFVTWLTTRRFLSPLKQLMAQIQSFEALSLHEGQGEVALPSTLHTPFTEFNEFQTVLRHMGAQILQNFKEQENAVRRESHLKEQHMSAQLNTLKNQINPHFLFNALNGIQGMIDVNPQTASEMIHDLSDLYRSILQCTDKITISLQEEMHIVKMYLSLQKRRFGKRLQFSFLLPEKTDIWIPSLMIQTLVENAVKHGLEPYKEGCSIEVKVTEEGSDFVCSIANQRLNPTGAHRVQAKSEMTSNGTGTGLANTRARLQLLYGPETTLDLDIQAKNGARATFRFGGKKY